MQLAKSKEKFEVLDVRSGPTLVKMIKFSIPIILSGALQQAFNTADSVVIGRFAGSNALGGISATAPIINLLVNFFMGLSIGAAVSISQQIGAGNEDGASKHAHNAIATALMCGIFIAIIGNLFCRPVLELLNTPTELLAYSEKYMRIYFSGVPFILLYNYGSAILRTMGDTRRPLFYLAIGGIANIILNLVFVLGFGMDTDGVAIATIVSNIISAGFVLYNLTHSQHCCRLTLKKIKLRKKEFLKIMALGLPAGVQGSMFSLSNMVMQSSINSFGSSVVAGAAAAGNIDVYVNYIGDGFAQAAMTFSGQNYGAGNIKRLKKIFIESNAIVFILSAILSAIIVIFREPLVKLFIVDNPEAINAGCVRMIFVGGLFAIGSVMSTASANIRGMGKSVVPMIVTVFSVCILRVIWVYTVFLKNRTLETLYLIYPLSWAVALVFHFITFIYFYRKMASGKMKIKI